MHFNNNVDQSLLAIYRSAQTVQTEYFLMDALEIVRQIVPFRSALWGSAALQDVSSNNFANKLNRNKNVFVYDAMQEHLECYERLDQENARMWSLIPSLIKEKLNSSEQMRIKNLDGAAKDFCFHQLPTVSGNVDKKNCKHVAFGAIALPALNQKNWLWLGRNTARQEFSSQEQDYLKMLMPHIFEAMHINFKLMANEQNIGVALSSIAGQKIQSNRTFDEFICREFGQELQTILPVSLLLGIKLFPYVHVGREIEVHIKLHHGLLYCTAKPKALNLMREGLSERESHVAELIAAGNSYKEVAKNLAISPITVRNHLSSIYRKLGINNAQSLAAKFAMGV